MFDIVLIFFTCYTLSMGVIVFVGFFIQRKKERQNSGSLILPSDIVVLVPFRNEEHRIQETLNCIKQLKSMPSEFVFIDDHSNDNTVQLINKELVGINYKVITAPGGSYGKKKALRYGIAHSDSKYILTFDADVLFDPNYFTETAKLTDADMYVLPAIMKAKRPWEYLYEIDLILVNAVNIGLSGIKRPIMASGANLLYKREVFNEVDNLDSHVTSASGDDTYLLRDFREGGKNVRLVSNLRNAIYTETPQSFREFIDQRLRWIGKTGDLKDNLSTTLAILQSILTITFFGFLIYFGIVGLWQIFFILIAIKSVIDLVLFFPYFLRIKRILTWLLIPIYELLYPFYVLIIITLLFTYKPKWKGRTIYADN